MCRSNTKSDLVHDLSYVTTLPSLLPKLFFFFPSYNENILTTRSEYSKSSGGRTGEEEDRKGSRVKF